VTPNLQAPAAGKPGAIQWDLKSPIPAHKAGDLIQTPKGLYKALDDKGNVEPVTQ
jgi:hypothetical protein